MSTDLTLPMPAELLIPHRSPMRLVDALVSYADAAGVVEARPGADCVLVDDAGALDEVALVELMAQGYAVIKGYDDLVRGRAISKGFLVGMKKLRITGRAAAGHRLLVHVNTVGSFEGFAVAEARIEHEGEIVASGTIKLWIFDDAQGGAA
jgi:3-hydroxyacyl-[acyl-carrier-protein] dehydratase